MTIDLNSFTPWASLAGGALIGLATAMFVLLNGRIAGVSGILAGVLRPARGDVAWRIAFLGGLIIAAPVYGLFTSLPEVRIDAGYAMLVVAGLLVGAGALAVAGLVNSFWVFLAMFAVLGLGNTVYHPADYALLGRHVPVERTGRVFSYHTFAGMLGNAAAPATLVYLYAVVGWRGAFLCAAALGVVAALVVFLTQEPPEVAKPAKKIEEPTDTPADGWKLLLSAPILANLVFFILLSMSGGGLYNYLVATLGALHGTPATVANTALTGLLAMSAVGVLVGGQLTGFTSRYGLVTAIGLISTATVCVLVGMIDFPALALILLMSSVGFFNGLTMPSRDMIVRAAAPRSAYGRVFGFVTTGFHLAGIVSPIIFGQMLDRGYPREIFFFMAFCALLSIATVTYSTTRKPAS